MYRVIEGHTDATIWLSSPLGQRIVRCKTGTRLVTASESLQGEWPEAVDVEEYLEDRRIYLRGAGLRPTDYFEELGAQSFDPSFFLRLLL